MFKKTVISALVAAACGAGSVSVQAQTPAPAAPAAAAPAAPASDHTFTGNVGVFSQYIFRGLTQTNRHPALQAGADYSHASGIYLGTWITNISWLKENFSVPGFTTGQYESGGRIEWDFYGGYKANFGKSDFTYDLGLLYYYYPGSPKPPVAGPAGCFYGPLSCPKANTTELYGALGWKWATLKYSHSIDNKTFGVPETSGTYYLELNADVPIGESGFTANLHWGKQKYKGQVPTFALSNNSLYSYSDWKIGLTYALPKDFTVGAFASGTSGASTFGYGAVTEPGGVYPRNIAKTTGTVFVKKTF